MNCMLIEKKIMHIYYNDLYGHALALDSSPGEDEIYNFGRTFLGHHYYILNFPSYMYAWK